MSQVMQISVAEGQHILNLAAEVEWEMGLDDDQKEFINRVIEALPGVEVPSILR